jgi:hypothetical protein
VSGGDSWAVQAIRWHSVKLVRCCDAVPRKGYLREPLDDRHDVLTLKTELSRLRYEVLGLRPDDAALWLARDRDSAPSAELEDAFISEDPKRPQHRVAVDTQDGRHVMGGG